MEELFAKIFKQMLEQELRRVGNYEIANMLRSGK